MSLPFSQQHQTVIAFERFFSRRQQDYWRGSALLLLILLSALLWIDTTITDITSDELLIGALCLTTAVYLDLLAWRLFGNATYFAGLYSTSGSGNYQQHGLTYEAMTVMYHGQADLTEAFLNSTFGQHIYVRGELTDAVVKTWLASNRHRIGSGVVSLAAGRATSLIDIVQAILTYDKDFVQFLQDHGVTPDAILGSAHLVLGHYYHQKRLERWWSRDVLSRRGSLGRTLTLGAWRDYVPYTKPLRTNAESPNEFEQHYLGFLHTILQSRRDSNVLLVSPDADINRVLLEKLQHTFVAGTALGSINTMSILTLDHDALLFENTSTVSVEAALRGILTEASGAGNMVLVLDELETVTSRYATRGVLFTHILEEFLTADRLHVIVTATTNSYANLKRTELALIKRCEEVIVEALTEETLLRYLTHNIFKLESRAGVIFSYHALTSIAKTVYSYDVPLGTRVQELAATIAEKYHDQPIITQDMAQRCLGEILDLPVGPLTQNERDILLSIERIMQQEVVGQDRAIHAIGIALRRMRAALVDTSRPLASFLFLGPSGVGKTETAKTLAKVYFGNEDSLKRFDMSEFADANAVSRLIGDSNTPSQLEDAIINHPHGLILLDEFEKSHPDVQELFLQILDEGSVTTFHGTTVRFRQHIIIATSNAGSTLIANTRDKRAESPILDSDVIAHIIRTRALAPELIGRFGDVILFDSLNYQEEVTIAHQLIATLGQKIRERGFVLSVDSLVPSIIVEQFHNSQFGARPIRHAIEHLLEDIIATRIIRGDVKPGDTITITRDDLPRSARA